MSERGRGLMRCIMPSLVCHVNACPWLSSFSLVSVALAAQSLSNQGAQARPLCAGSQSSSRHLLEPAASHHQFIQHLFLDPVVTKAIAFVNR